MSICGWMVSFWVYGHGYPGHKASNPAVTSSCWMTEKSGFVSWQGQETFLFSNAFRPSLENTPPHTQPLPKGREWVGGKGVPVVNKVSGDEADLSPPSCADFKNEWRYTFTPAYDFVACTEKFVSLSWVPEKSPPPHARCGAKKQASRERIKLSTWAQNSSAASAQRTDRRLKPPEALPQFNYINSYRSSQKTHLPHYREQQLQMFKEKFQWILPSSGLLRGVWWFETGVSELPTHNIFKGQYFLLWHLDPWRWDR